MKKSCFNFALRMIKCESLVSSLTFSNFVNNVEKPLMYQGCFLKIQTVNPTKVTSVTIFRDMQKQSIQTSRFCELVPTFCLYSY